MARMYYETTGCAQISTLWTKCKKKTKITSILRSRREPVGVLGLSPKCSTGDAGGASTVSSACSFCTFDVDGVSCRIWWFVPRYACHSTRFPASYIWKCIMYPNAYIRDPNSVQICIHFLQPSYLHTNAAIKHIHAHRRMRAPARNAHRCTNPPCVATLGTLQVRCVYACT